MDEWISVNDRLPDIGENVLVFAKGRVYGFTLDTVMTITKRFYPLRDLNSESTYIDWAEPWAFFFFDYDITHWMPLPEPPKEDKDEEN